MKAATEPAPPAELAPAFAALFTHDRVALNKTAAIFQPDPAQKVDRLASASRQSQALAAAAVYIQQKHARSLRGPAALAYQSAAAAEIVAGTFRPEWFATATPLSDQCVPHTVYSDPAPGVIPPCGLDPARLPTKLSFVAAGPAYNTPAPNTPGRFGSPGANSSVKSGSWADRYWIIRRRRYLLPFVAGAPGTRQFFARLSINWTATASNTAPAEPATVNADWLRWSVWAHASLNRPPQFWPYGDASQPAPPLSAVPPLRPPPANPFLWTGSRSFTLDLTAHNLAIWPQAARYFWVVSWIRRSGGIPCPAIDSFDARFSDNLILYQLR